MAACSVVSFRQWTGFLVYCTDSDYIRLLGLRYRGREVIVEVGDSPIGSVQCNILGDLAAASRRNNI